MATRLFAQMPITLGVLLAGRVAPFGIVMPTVLSEQEMSQEETIA